MYIGRVQLGPDELRREIDATLAELEQVEADVVAIFDELLGEAAARKVADYFVQAHHNPRMEPLTRDLSREDPPAGGTSVESSAD